MAGGSNVRQGRNVTGANAKEKKPRMVQNCPPATRHHGPRWPRNALALIIPMKLQNSSKRMYAVVYREYGAVRRMAWTPGFGCGRS
jgi:hypothetical protein